MAMFDLPVMTPEDRRRYTRFRQALLKDGFIMLQFSVYARYCQSEESSTVHRKRVRQALPEQGNVRLLAVTDKQYAKMDCYIGKKKSTTEEPPDQLVLF